MGKYRKAIVAVLGAAVTTALTIPDLPPQWQQTLMVVSAMLSALAVYVVPNEQAAAKPPKLDY